MSEHPSPPPSARALLVRSVARHRARLSAGFLLLVVWQLCETFVPVMIGVIIDRAVATSQISSLVVLLLAFAALFAVLSYAYRFGARLVFAAVQQEIHDLRVEIAGRALHPRGVRSTALPGQTLSLATADAELVGIFLRLLGFSISSVLSLAFAAVMLLRIDFTLGLIVIIGVPCVLGLAQVATPAISRRTGQQQSSIADASGTATDLVRGLRVLKGVGAERVAVQRYRRLSRAAQLAGVSSTSSVGVMTGLTATLSGLFLAVVALVAGRKALSGEITIGELIAIVGLTQFLAEPLQMLGEIGAYAARSLAAARRIVDYLAAGPLVDARDEQTPTAVLDRRPEQGPAISITLPKGDHLASPPGEFLAITMSDPGDADQLMRALAGEDRSDLALAGVEAAMLSIGQRHEHLLVNPHHVDLFEGSLHANIDPHRALGPQATTVLLERSCAADVVSQTDSGLEAHLTPDGATYSGGQRQRIALARALASDAPVLVLHDPTTAVDAVTEQRIAEGLLAARTDRTTWVITSSPALLARADRVVLITAGKVRAQGRHRELIDHDSYRELVLR